MTCVVILLPTLLKEEDIKNSLYKEYNVLKDFIIKSFDLFGI